MHLVFPILAICSVIAIIALIFIVPDYLRLIKENKTYLHDLGVVDDPIDKAFKKEGFQRARQPRVYVSEKDDNYIVIQTKGVRWDFIDLGNAEFQTTAPEITANSIISFVRTLDRRIVDKKNNKDKK